ncbi:MAG TPA: D-alanyl-D-alanine carboxypeptidase family protein, partial [Archangium sp.]|nr:D-alanyl-D-alanine carboxypeptidase family protein [Archangium sp.]
LVSNNGLYRLVLQNDGNLVLYGPDGVRWTPGAPSTGNQLVLQDGNLVLYDTSGKFIWQSGSGGNIGAWLALQHDGNLVVYSASGKVLWTPPSPAPAPTDSSTVTAPVGPEQTVMVEGIRVHRSIANAVGQMIRDARAAGINLTGGGWRSMEDQINVRRKNCGTSHYAIYDMPASQCKPPTARPGTSQHQRGLAIDFTGMTRSSPGFAWLKANAARYGFFNLPSEPWHWSTTGR